MNKTKFSLKRFTQTATTQMRPAFLLFCFQVESTVFINRILNYSKKPVATLVAYRKTCVGEETLGTPIYHTIEAQKIYSRAIDIETKISGIPIFGLGLGTAFISVGPATWLDTQKLPVLCCSFCKGENINPPSEELQKRLDNEEPVDGGELVSVPKISTVIGLSEPLNPNTDYWFDLKITSTGIAACLIRQKEHVVAKKDFPEPLSPSGSDE